MVRGRAIGLGVAATAVLLAATSAPASGAAAVKLSGSLSGARLPRPAAGASLVQALNLSDGTLAAADYADRRGRFSLKVPPGPYAMVGGSVFFKRGLPTIRLVGALRARAGKPRRLPLSLRPVRRRTRHLSAREATTTGPAGARIVGVPYFTGAAPYQNRGLAAMVETDLAMLNKGPPCSFTVVEVQRRNEIIREIRLQQTRFFDPATRVRPGRLLQPKLLVKGSLSAQAGGDLSYTIRVVNARSGEVKGSTSGRIPENTFIGSSEGIARELAKIICRPDDLLYLGTVTGTLRVEGGPRCGGAGTEHEQFSYNASLASFQGPQDPFEIVTGSGGLTEGQGAKAYDDAGSGTYVLDPCSETQTPGCSTGFRRQGDGSSGQVLFTVEGSTVKATAIPFNWEATTNACGGIGPLGDATKIGEGTFPLSMVGDQTITVSLTRHDSNGTYTYDGSGTLTLRRVN
jgi:hypothetical protein